MVGAVSYLCLSGVMVTSGGCSGSCPAGTVKLPGGDDFNHGALAHGFALQVGCPVGFSGQVALACNNRSVAVHSECHADCPAGAYTAPAGYSVFHGIMLNGSSEAVGCPATHSGELILECRDGEVTPADGACYRDCSAGILLVVV